MTLQDTDNFLVQRDTTPYKVESQNFSSLQDDDLFVVSRDGQNYKVKASEINVGPPPPQEEPPSVDSVSLIESNPDEDPRFTSQTFVASSQVTDGLPVAEKTIDAHVDGTLSKQVQFDELLESSGDVLIDYSSGLTQTGGATDLPAVFDGVYQTKAEMPIGSTIVWDCESFNLPAAEWYLQMFAQNNSGSNVQVSIACEFRDSPDVSYTLNTNTNGSILVYFTGDVYNGGAWDQISSPTKVTVTYLAGPSGAGDFGLQYVLQNNEVLLNTSAIQLVFPTNADMQGLAAGDTVTQTTVFTEPLESSVIVTIENTTALSATSSRVSNPEWMYDGEINTFGTVQAQDSGLLFQLDAGQGFEINPGEYLIIEGFAGASLNGQNMSAQLNDVDGNIISGAWITFTISTGSSVKVAINIPENLKPCRLNAMTIHTPQVAGMNVSAVIIRDTDGNDNKLTEFNTLGTTEELVFATGTDMAALEAGDTVSQTSVPNSDNVSSSTVSSITTTNYNARYSGRNTGDATLVNWENASLTENGVDISNKPTNVSEITVVYFQFPGPCKPTLGFGNSFSGPYPNTIYSSDNGVNWTQQYSSPTDLGNYTATEDHQYWAWQNNYGGGWNTQNYRVLSATNSLNVTQLNCASDLNLSTLSSMDLITQEGSSATGRFYSAAGSTVNLNESTGTWGTGKLILPSATTTGTVGSITDTAVTLSSNSGTWTDGVDVTTAAKTTTGTVGSVTGTTTTLSSSTGSWANGAAVVGPQKTITEDNVRLYCAFDSNGNVTDLQNNPQDPPYTTTDSNPGLTFTFPATFPSGQTPDEELPDGTTFTVEVSATNTEGTSGPVSATVQPEPGIPPEPVRPAYLTGLTTLYDGNSTSQSITTGVDLVDNDGLVWIKNRSSSYHVLNDTVRGAQLSLYSNDNLAEGQSLNALTSFTDNGFTVGNGADVNGQNQYVAWTFQKSPGYFDVVKYESDGVNGKQIPHSLGTKPGLIIIKSLETTHDWIVYHKDVYTDTAGANYVLSLSSTDSKQDRGVAYFPEVTDTYFKVATSSFTNSNAVGQGYIAYLFADDNRDVVKCGSYVGNQTLQTVQVGFKPQWLLIKNIDQDARWYLVDNKRGERNTLFPNSNEAELNQGGDGVTFLEDGFSIKGAGLNSNALNNNYIYVAIAAPPIARSQTNEEFVESQAKFLTYDNRRDVKVGEEAIDVRHKVIKEAENLGLTKDQIEQVFKNG